MGVGRINIHSFYDNYTIGSKHNNNLQNTEDDIQDHESEIQRVDAAIPAIHEALQCH